MGLFGAKKRRTREIAHEVLKPLGIGTKDLTYESQRNFERSMRRVVDRDQDNDLYNRSTAGARPREDQ